MFILFVTFYRRSRTEILFGDCVVVKLSQILWKFQREIITVGSNTLGHTVLI